MRHLVRKLAVVLGLALAITPLAWEALLVPPVEAQFQGFAQAVTLQNAATTTGAGNRLDTSGGPIVALQTTITGTGNITVIPEGSLDAITFNTLTCYPLGSSTGTAIIGTGNPTSLFVRCNVVAVPTMRARVATISAGSVTVKGYATQSYFPLGTTVP